jgi:hypothetical protein
MILKNSFTYAGVTYQAFFDTDDNSLRTSFFGGHPLPSLDPANWGYTDGEELVHGDNMQCVANVAYRFFAATAFPFVTMTVGAPDSCSSADSCDLIIGDLIATNETALNAKDGTVTGTVITSADSFNCSIDGVTFSAPGVSVFTGLAPGDYTFYVKDSNGCTAQQDFSVIAFGPVYGCTDPAASNYNPAAQVNDGSCIYPEPDPNDAEALNNLYEKPDQFRLITLTDTWEIDEPKDWDKIAIVLKRDDTYHGVDYLFSEGDIKLRFDDPAGRQILIEEHDKYGNDAIVRFQFGFDKYGAFIAELDAYVDFNVYEKQENYVSVGVKRKTFNDLLETRADTLVSLKDGAISLPLHSKLIRETTIVNTGGKTGDIVGGLSVNDWNGSAPSGDAPFLSYWSYLDLSGATQNDLCPDAPTFGIYSDNPLVTGQYLFKTDGGGVFNISLKFSVVIHIKLDQKSICICPGGHNCGPRHGYWSYKWFLVVNNIPNVIELPGGQSGFTNSRYNDVAFQTEYTTSLTLNQGDEVFLYGQYICEKRGCVMDGLVQMDQVYQTLNLSGDTLAKTTTTKAFMSFEVANAVIKEVTDNQGALVSNLLGRTDIGYPADGCAALIAYSNGYQIRGFDIANRPIQISFKDFIEGLNAMYCVGKGYELNNQNNYVVRLERFDYFYQNVEIILFDQVSDYVEDIDTGIIYNELEFGYKKFTNNLPSSANTLDEFCTLHDYLTPIQSFKQKLSQQCSQITSGYAIELTRRQAFLDTPEDSWTYDEDNFAVSSVRSGTGFKSETNENFTASGIIGAETAYNIRQSPARMFDRWGKWVNSGLAYKKPSDIIRNTFVAKNGDLISQLITPDTCDSTQVFKESDSLVLAAVSNFDKLFYPTKITFSKRISWDTLRLLRRCFENRDPLGRNNGYISVIDCDGNAQQGFLMELSYNPESELANFVLRKKYVNLNVPFDCSVYSSWDFGQFEAATGLPAEIEQCKFENFA